MSRLADTFAALRAGKRKALVAYLTAGDPDLETSVLAAEAAVDAGADILEVGVPFSDPIADGPVIQRAMGRALAGGGGFEPALEVVRRVRAGRDVPIVLFGYANPLMYSGVPASCARAREAGADALLVVDVPPEESEPMRAAAAEAGLQWVCLVAPTTGAERAARIVATATGFVYLVSMTGVTGGALEAVDHLAPIVEAIRSGSQLPICVGFGVRDQASARATAGVADGVVVGSAIVSALEDGAKSGTGPEQVAALVAQLRAGVNGLGEP